MTANVPQLMCNYFNSLVVAINSTLYTGSTNHSFGDGGLCDYNCGSGGVLVPLLSKEIIVVGRTISLIASPSTYEAFHWTAATGMVGLGTLGGAHSEAWGISSDGKVIAGTSLNAGGDLRLFRWTQATGMVDLGSYNGGFAGCTFVNSDGSVIVGNFQNALSGDASVFRWTQATGMVELFSVAASHSAIALDISSDGSAVVGINGLPITTGQHAFYWSVSGGFTDLGVSGTGTASAATGVTADGLTVVGWTETAAFTSQAFYWTLGVGKTLIPNLAGYTYADCRGAVSDDGSIIYGTCSDPTKAAQSFKWTASSGAVATTTHQTDFGSDYVAESCSPSGSVCYGDFAQSDFMQTPYVWTQVDGTLLFSSPTVYLDDNYSTYPNLNPTRSMSSDGTVNVGKVYPLSTSPYHAYYWTKHDGLVDIGVLSGNLTDSSVAHACAVA